MVGGGRKPVPKVASLFSSSQPKCVTRGQDKEGKVQQATSHIKQEVWAILKWIHKNLGMAWTVFQELCVHGGHN